MKIADFFIALGFQVKGKEDVDKADQSVQKLEFSSLKLLAGVTAVNAAFYAMITKAVEAGVSLQRFALTTGLSTDELQRWQLTAVRGNVAAGTMVQAIDAIQKARAALAFGDTEPSAPWMLLGLDPREDPIKVLQKLQEQIVRLDPAIAKNVLGRLGLSEDLYYLMRQPNFGKSSLAKNMIVSPEEVNNLAKLGSAWREFLFTFGQVMTRFASQFAEPLAAILKQFTQFLALGARFVDWLESGSKGAEYMMYALLGLLVVVTGLGIALGILALGPVGAFVGLLGIMAVALGGIVVLIQDFWVACEGGKSAFDWGDGLLLTVKNVEALSLAITVLIDTWDRLVAAVKSGKGVLDILGDIGAAAGGNPSALVGAALMDKNSLTNQNIQTNHINVSVPAGSGAHETGREVGRGASRQISDAFGQMPLPSR